MDWSHDANVLPYVPTGDDDADLEIDDEDDAAAMPKSVVIDDAFLWEGDRPLLIPFADTVIYETHVKGFTMRHPEIREDLRGTYAGLASDAGDQLPQGSRRHRGRAAARPSHRRRVVPRRARADATTGATARSATSRRTPSTRPPAAGASRCASSRGWSRRCTGPGSR